MPVSLTTWITASQLIELVGNAREKTIALVEDLSDEQLLGPRLSIINPLLWEIGHVAWFQESWVLRHVCKQPALRDDADTLWDSIAIPHDIRWDLPLTTREETLLYIRGVRDRVMEMIGREDPSEELTYFVLYSVFHEDMHTEAFTYTRQTLGYPAPHLGTPTLPTGSYAGPLPGDAENPGGTFMLGASHDDPFVFDNEKWGHPVELRPFGIARAAVTQGEFAAFVDDAGYHRQELWSAEGWRWREAESVEQPAYWRREANGRWLRRDFDEWVRLEEHRPVVHVNWFEADAYCRWAGRRLPTEAEWEAAAALGQSGDKRSFPWGTSSPTPERANLDWRALGCVDVAAHPDGDSACGCRQMIGNVWEWTSSAFLPYPGFVADPYKEYSEPWFGNRQVLRGGCWATRGRMLRNTWRNFHTPDRRDVWAGFRTCAVTE